MPRSLLCTLALLAAAGRALAQPTPAPAPNGDKVDAKALMLSGVRLLEIKDYLGALAIFKDAYARFASAKILLNIGTTNKLLGRKADAANAYQRYLDSKDADPAKVGEVKAALAELDKDVGILDITVTPADAELQFADEWIPAAQAAHYRIAAGDYTINLRRDGYKPDSRAAAITAGDHAALTLVLQPFPKESGAPTVITVHDVVAPTEQPRSRFGAFTVVHMSVVPKLGAAPMLGVTADATEQLSLAGAFIFGPGLFKSDTMYTVAPPPKAGIFLGSSFAFSTGMIRPRASAGLPIFFSSGPRFSLRGAGGVEYVASRNLSMSVELGVEVELNPQSDIRHAALVPALGVIGRL